MRRLMLLSVLGFTGFCLTLSALPLWAVGNGVPEAAAGLPTTVMLVATVLIQGTVPAAVSRFGLRNVLVAGLVALGAPAPLLLLDTDLWWLLVLSAIRGGGFAVLTVLGATITSRIAPPERRGEAIGLYGLAIAVPNLFAVPAGVALVSADQFVLAAILAAAPLLAVPAVPGLVREVPATGAALAGERLHSSRSAVVAVLPPTVVLLAVTFAGGGLLTFLPIALPSGLMATVGLLLFGAAAALSRWGVGIVADRNGTRLLLPVSVLATVLGSAVVGAGLVLSTLGTATILVAVTVLGIGYGATQNLTLLVAFSRTPHDNVASAVWNIGFDAGTGLGAVGLGLLAATGAGLSGAFALSALLVLPVLALTRSPIRPGSSITR